jgi:UDP-glucose-4-epimerase GalE
MRVLVVGGAGYIGSQTAKLLARAGHEVSVIDNLSTGFRELVRYGKFYEGDILDSAFLAEVLPQIRPEAVMHFAAKALVGESVAQPELYYKVNVGGSLCLLEALLRLKQIPVFVFSSTCSLYGITDQPLDEDSAVAPTNPYARTKLQVEEALKDCHARQGLKFTVLRYFNASGADPEGEVGELHEPETHLIPLLLLNAVSPARYPFRIFGTDYPTPDGTCIRDYIHVEDLARAHIAAMERMAAGKGGAEFFNLGTRTGHSVREVIAQVEKTTGKKLSLSEGPKREGDPPRLVSAGTKAKDILGWEPEHDLASIVETAWKFTRERRR